MSEKIPISSVACNVLFYDSTDTFGDSGGSEINAPIGLIYGLDAKEDEGKLEIDVALSDGGYHYQLEEKLEKANEGGRDFSCFDFLYGNAVYRAIAQSYPDDSTRKVSVVCDFLKESPSPTPEARLALGLAARALILATDSYYKIVSPNGAVVEYGVDELETIAAERLKK